MKKKKQTNNQTLFIKFKIINVYNKQTCDQIMNFSRLLQPAQKATY